jgi:hypothetical protein
LTPTVGRTVHYVAYGTPGGEYPSGAHRAAIITEVGAFRDGANYVGLCILNPTGLFFTRDVKEDQLPPHSPGTWHWPERE